MESYIHHQIHTHLLNARHLVFISDERIDGDSLGSALALADYLAQQGKIVPVYVASPIPEQYQRLPRIHQCTMDVSIFEHPDIDVVVVFDCSYSSFIQKIL